MLLILSFIGFVIICITTYSIVEITLQYKQNLAQLEYTQHKCKWCGRVGVPVKKED
ncbi:hypothetical protein [Phage f2b1]|nr:hypothetical protein [Phage f2b1]